MRLGVAPMSGPRRSLRTESVVNLGFVTSAAVILVGLTTVVLAGGELDATLRPLLVLWLASTVVFVLFGAYVVRRLVIVPLQRLSAEADLLAAGGLEASRPGYQSRELAHLSNRYRAMAESLLDAQSQMVRVRSWRGSEAWRRAWHTRFGTRWERSAPTWTSCAGAGPIGRSPMRCGAPSSGSSERCMPKPVREAAGSKFQ